MMDENIAPKHVDLKMNNKLTYIVASRWLYPQICNDARIHEHQIQDGFEDRFVLCQRPEECKTFKLPRSTKRTQRYLVRSTSRQSICSSLYKVLINHRRKLQLPVPSLVSRFFIG